LALKKHRANLCEKRNNHTPVVFPGGYEARLVILEALGDEIPMYADMIKKWWLYAASPPAAFKLQQIITRDGNPLPMDISICVTLTL